MQGADVFHFCTHPRKLIEQAQLRVAREQGHVFVLAMHFHQAAGERTGGRQGDGLVIHQHAAAASGLQFAAQNQPFVIASRDAVFLQPIGPRSNCFGGKNRGDHGAVFSGANDLRRGAPAQRQSQSIHQDGLAGTGLPGKQVQAGPEFHGQVIDDSVVLNVYFAEHGVVGKQSTIGQLIVNSLLVRI